MYSLPTFAITPGSQFVIALGDRFQVPKATGNPIRGAVLSNQSGYTLTVLGGAEDRIIPPGQNDYIKLTAISEYGSVTIIVGTLNTSPAIVNPQIQGTVYEKQDADPIGYPMVNPSVGGIQAPFQVLFAQQISVPTFGVTETIPIPSCVALMGGIFPGIGSGDITCQSVVNNGGPLPQIIVQTSVFTKIGTDPGHTFWPIPPIGANVQLIFQTSSGTSQPLVFCYALQSFAGIQELFAPSQNGFFQSNVAANSILHSNPFGLHGGHATLSGQAVTAFGASPPAGDWMVQLELYVGSGNWQHICTVGGGAGDSADTREIWTPPGSGRITLNNMAAATQNILGSLVA